jgi:hypothetical protein
MFVLPYIFSHLYFNKDAFVEIYVRSNNFDCEAINLLYDMFESSFTIKNLPFDVRERKMPESAFRFIMEPEVKLEYTYIGDVDILCLLSNIAESEGKKISEHGGIFINRIRPSSKRLTGLHCVKTNPYYDMTRNIRESIICNSGSDEMMLYQIVDEAIGGLDQYKNDSMPDQGFHLSLNREPLYNPNFPNIPPWNLCTKEMRNIYLEMKKSNEWSKIYPYFDPKYKDMLSKAENAFDKADDPRIIKNLTTPAKNDTQSFPIVKIYYSIPWDTDKDIGKYYNAFMNIIGENDYACFIDADSCFTTCFYGKQIEDIVNKYPECGFFTAVTNRLGNPTQLAGKWDSDDIKEHRIFGEQLAKEKYDKIKSISIGCGVLILISKKVWKKIGGFKETGILGVDNYLYIEACKKGEKIYLMTGVYLYHWYRGGNRGDVKHLLK